MHRRCRRGGSSRHFSLVTPTQLANTAFTFRSLVSYHGVLEGAANLYACSPNTDEGYGLKKRVP